MTDDRSPINPVKSVIGPRSSPDPTARNPGRAIWKPGNRSVGIQGESPYTVREETVRTRGASTHESTPRLDARADEHEPDPGRRGHERPDELVAGWPLGCLY